MEYLKTKWLLLKTYFGLIKLTLITRMVHFMGINLYVKAKTSDMVIVVFGIKHIHLPAPRLLVLLHVESHQRFLELLHQGGSWGDVKKIKSWKISAIISDVSEKHSIVYIYACTELSRIEKYHSDKQLDDNC